ncbi:hypothetical protein HMJ29_01420 [Hymenobacter taeanensis]|uniref:Uncharacterized protein n=1 Tax=Hymenobacter taeanensis TaxID=2735321 RepID=A0A6M6BES6_9BACT|nr:MULTISPECIES: hypothetical protein [Hymenobacter]QJX45665.1 hypothetical protein HMJ29_01420 [Hymenobacter taeanensis]UOQ79501.1 hypothetical protein MUN83_11615 [Hymenobacter sp. 5414T-23]
MDSTHSTSGQEQPAGSVLAGSQPHLEATLHALQTTQLPHLLPAAGDNLYRWMNLLQTVEGNQFAPLILELQNLYNAIDHGNPNGPQVKDSLQKLAELTTQAATTADAESGGKLRELAQALQAAASTL